MDEIQIFWWIWWIFASIGLAVIPILLMIPAPYGKFTRAGWGPLVRSDIGWLVQESPSFIVFLVTAAYSPVRNLHTMILGLLFLIHYFNRCFIYPIQLSGKTTSLSVVFSALFFTITNGYLQARALFKFDQSLNSLENWSFWVGIVVWEVGFIINLQSDQILRSLRRPGETGYKTPYGGLFNYVSAANYFGETIEHAGWAIASSNLTA